MGLEEKDESVHRKLVADRALTLDIGLSVSHTRMGVPQGQLFTLSCFPSFKCCFQILKISGYHFCFFFFFHFEKTETGIKNLCSSLHLAVKQMYRVMLHLLIPGTLLTFPKDVKMGLRIFKIPYRWIILGKISICQKDIIYMFAVLNCRGRIE